MRGSDILFFQCRVKNSTHLAPGLQVVSAGAALATPALVFQVTHTRWLLAAGDHCCCWRAGYWCYSVDNTGGPPSSFRNEAAFLPFF